MNINKTKERNRPTEKQSSVLGTFKRKIGMTNLFMVYKEDGLVLWHENLWMDCFLPLNW